MDDKEVEKRVVILASDLLHKILESLENLQNVPFLRRMLACLCKKRSLKDFRTAPREWRFYLGHRTRRCMHIVAEREEDEWEDDDDRDDDNDDDDGPEELDTDDLLEQVALDESIWEFIDIEASLENPDTTYFWFQNVKSGHGYTFRVSCDLNSISKADDAETDSHTVTPESDASPPAQRDAQKRLGDNNVITRPTKRPAQDSLSGMTLSEHVREAEFALIRQMISLHPVWILDYGTLQAEDLDSLLGTNQLSATTLDHYITMTIHDMEARERVKVEKSSSAQHLNGTLTIYDTRVMAAIEREGAKAARRLWTQPKIAYRWQNTDVLVCQTFADEMDDEADDEADDEVDDEVDDEAKKFVAAKFRRCLDANFPDELEGWSEHSFTSFGKQSSSLDSGVFVAQAIKQLSRSGRGPGTFGGHAWPFGIEDAPSLRKQMLSEIIKQRLE